MAAARVGGTATGSGLSLVGEVVLIPGDHDGVAALLPLCRRHDLANGVTPVGVAGGNETVGARAGARAGHVMTLFRADEAEVRQIAGGEVSGDRGGGNHGGKRARRTRE